MERKLLLLGLLTMHEMHGYQINEMIDAHLGASIDFKKPTVYKLLRQMQADGWLEERAEETGNRPTRRVYTITDAGRKAFFEVLRQSLAGYTPLDFMGHISLGFLDMLPPNETIDLLKQRKARIRDLLETVQSDDQHHGSMQLIIEYQIRHFEMEKSWLDDVIKHVADDISQA